MATMATGFALMGALMQGGMLTQANLSCPETVSADKLQQARQELYVEFQQKHPTISQTDYIDAWNKGAAKAKAANKKNPVSCDQFIAKMKKFPETIEKLR